MRMTILTRMVIGYLAIFIPVTAVSVYSLVQLSRFHKVTAEILQIDNRIKEVQQKLADSILAQTRYEKKYILTKDKELYEQFLIVGNDITKRVNDAISMADTANKRESLIRIKDYYDRYKSAFDAEVNRISRNQGYSHDGYRERNDKLVDEILWELRNVKVYTEQDTYERIEHLGESGSSAVMVGIIAGAGFIVSGVIISILITRSITKPLSFMRKRTRQVSAGDFECTLDLSSPPELGDLAHDFNLMCSKLKETDKMKSDFFSLMAHELRTPLASIKEGSSLLLEGIADDPQKRKEVLTIIGEESNRLVDLVNSLLDLSKMEAGMIVLKIENSDIRSLINKAVSGIRPLAMNKNITIILEMPDHLHYVRIDRERILQALRNLIGNAVKFTPGGGHVRISVHYKENELRVSMADTGPGIPKEDLDAIFDKFQQAQMPSYNKIKGTGLGLAIVKYIITAHGGKVWVESELGHGSTFILMLPA